MIETIGVIGTIFFGILSVFLVIKYHRIKQPTFYFNYSLLQSRKHPEIKIMYNDTELENISRALILFCNIGKKEIRKDDIPTKTLPSITTSNKLPILSCSIIGTSNDSINISYKIINKNRIDFEFDYLNYNDGVIFEILLNGNIKEAKRPIQFQSTLIGAKKARAHIYQNFGFSDRITWYGFILFLFGLTVHIVNKGISFYHSGIIKYNYIIGAIITFGLGYILGFTNIITPFKKAPTFSKEYFN